MTTNSPSGKRRAVGISITPGSPKLPKVTRCVSLAAALVKNKDDKTIMSDSFVGIFQLSCWDTNSVTFLFAIEIGFYLAHSYQKTLKI